MQRTTKEDELKVKEAKLKSLLVGGMAGDSTAYHAFLKELAAHLRAFLRRRLTALPDELEDLVQESLLAVHNARHTYDEQQPLSAWVQAIAKYKLIDLLRRRSGYDQLNDPLDEELEFFSSQDAEAAEAKRDLNKLLETLPDNQRLPILHTKLEGLSVEEAATVTGMSVSAIKVGVHRGLKALAARIRGD